MRILLKNSSVAALMGFGASILIHPFVPGVEPGMIVLVGASGRGKTTAMRAIASMISEPSKPSKPGSYIMTFRTTENGLEGRLEAKNHCPSLIDEIGAASTGMNWSAAGYMIANGAGKLRMNADSSMRETKTWATQTIASGEESFASKMNAERPGGTRRNPFPCRRSPPRRHPLLGAPRGPGARRQHRRVSVDL